MSKKAKILSTCAAALFVIVGVFVAFLFFPTQNARARKAYNVYEEINAVVQSIVSDGAGKNGSIPKSKLKIVLEDACSRFEEFEKDGKIERYYYQPGDTCVYVELPGSIGYVFAPEVESITLDDGNEIINVQPFAKSPSLLPDSGESNAVSPIDAANELAKAFPDMSFDNSKKDAEQNAENVLELQDNSIMLWCGHGGYNKEIGSYLELNAEDGIDIEFIKTHYEKLANGVLLIGKNILYVTSAFFDSLEDGALDNSLVYLGTSNSLSDDRLSDSILDKGAVAVLGNTKTVCKQYNLSMLYDFCNGLTRTSNGNFNSLFDALAYAKSKNGNTDPGVLGETWGSEVEIRYKNEDDLQKGIKDIYTHEKQDAVSPGQKEVSATYILEPSIDADSIKFFHSGWDYNFCVISLNGKDGIIGYDGKIILPQEYKDISPKQTSPNGPAKLYATREDYTGGFVEPDGTVGEEFVGGWGFEETCEVYWNTTKNEAQIFYGAFPDQYSVSSFSDEIYNSYTSYTYEMGAITKADRTIIPVKSISGYKKASNPDAYDAQGTYTFENLSEKYGLYDANAKRMVTDFAFDKYAHSGMVNGIIPVKKDGKWSYANAEGKLISDFIYDASEQDEEHMYTALNGYIIVRQGDMWGLLNTNGDVILECKYQGVSQVNPNGLFWVKENGKWGVMKAL